MVDIKNRIPTPGMVNRKKITFEDDGTVRYAKVDYADEPIEIGTPITAELLNSIPKINITITEKTPTRIYSVTALSVARDNLSSSLAGSNKIVFCGGSTSGTNFTSQIDIYDEALVRTGANMSSARGHCPCATDGNGDVLIFAGATTGGTISNIVDKFNHLTHAVTQLSPLQVPRYLSAAVRDGNGNVLVAGGYKGGSPAQSDAVEKYDVNGVRTTLPSLSSMRTT